MKIAMTLVLLVSVSACASVDQRSEAEQAARLERAAAAARSVDDAVLRLQVQDLCWRFYDGEHGCYLP